MLNVGWVSVSPDARTGYGRLTRDIGFRLVDMGVPITFIGSYGIDVVVWGGVREQETFKGNKVTILTLTDYESAPTVIQEDYAKQYKFDIIIGFMDCFGLEFLNNLLTLPTIFYVPIDGPWTGKMSNYVRNAYKIVAYSKFGFSELQKWFPPTKIEYIDHIVDTDLFNPLSKDEYDEAREWMARDDELRPFAPPVPKDTAFLAVELAANIGPRKCLPLLMRTWARFVEKHKDNPPHLILQTNAYAPGKGYDLVAHRSNLKMKDYIHFPVYDPIVHPVPDEQLRMIYGASDIYAHNAVAEGRCMPMVECMSCGKPPIAPDNSAMTEVVLGNGWLVDSIDPEDYIEYPVYVPTLQEYKIPSQKSLLQKLEEAYSSPDLVRKYGENSRRFVVDNMSPDVIMPKWIRLLESAENELELFKKLGEVLRGPPAGVG